MFYQTTESQGTRRVTIFLQIFFANIVLLFVFIAVHEVGHWSMGIVAGIPVRQMKIRLLTFPQQVALRDGTEWASVSNYDRYFALLAQYVPSRSGQFLYVVGGFLFETGFLIALSIVLAKMGYWLLAIVAPGLSLSMFLVYVFLMDIPQSRRLQRPWGDTTILSSLAPVAGVAVAVAMALVRVVLIMAAWPS
jgi:hypothetical protein